MKHPKQRGGGGWGHLFYTPNTRETLPVGRGVLLLPHGAGVRVGAASRRGPALGEGGTRCWLYNHVGRCWLYNHVGREVLVI